MSLGAHAPDVTKAQMTSAADGAPRHPDWYYNVVAIPHTAIEVGTEVIEVTARVAEGGARLAVGPPEAVHPGLRRARPDHLPADPGIVLEPVC